MMRSRALVAILLGCTVVALRLFALSQLQPRERAPGILQPADFRHYFAQFSNDEKSVLGEDDPFPWEWFANNVPLLEVPDKEIEEIYYFRWYAFQKHIKNTPDGSVIDEFLDNVPWAGKFNTISAAAGHHIREARWLRNPTYAEAYAQFWFTPDAEPRRYSFAAADSVYQLYLATGARQFATDLLPALVKNFSEWERSHQDQNGLFWQIDDRDGMEFSAGGSGYRPTINSYMYGDAVAIWKIAELAEQEDVAKEFRVKADKLRALINTRLWNPKAKFYETVPQDAPSSWAEVRELVGFIPWYFDIPPGNRSIAWYQLFDPAGFDGKFGPTTAERRSPRFGSKNPHECLWNGPSWPFATTQTLVALANLIDNQEQSIMSSGDYLRLFSAYTRSQHLRLPDGRAVPWIDEDLDADSGEWIARDILKSRNEPPPNRGRYYNHSGYADLVITGLIGLRPTRGAAITIRPLVPPGKWDYFALDDLPYHGHLLTIMYDQTGGHYHRGRGLTIWCDGLVIGHSASLTNPTTAVLPDSSGTKHSGTAFQQPHRKELLSTSARVEGQKTMVR
jgi:hypothetical protein